MAKPHKVVLKKKSEEEDVPRDRQGYRRRDYEGLELLTKEIKSITQPILGKRGFSGVDIVAYWTDIVGEELAWGIRPEKLTFEKEMRTNGTLHVKTSGGAFAVIFEHQKDRVIERINTFFGYPAVSKIRIAQGKLAFPQNTDIKPVRMPSEAQLEELREKVAIIDDADLRQATFEMGLAFLKRKLAAEDDNQ